MLGKIEGRWMLGKIEDRRMLGKIEGRWMLGKIEGRRRRGRQRMRWLDSTTKSTDMSLSKLPEIVKDRGPWRVAVVGSQTVRHD